MVLVGFVFNFTNEHAKLQMDICVYFCFIVYFIMLLAAKNFKLLNKTKCNDYSKMPKNYPLRKDRPMDGQTDPNYGNIHFLSIFIWTYYLYTLLLCLNSHVYLKKIFQKYSECKFKFCNCKKTNDYNCQKMKYFKS